MPLRWLFNCDERYPKQPVKWNIQIQFTLHEYFAAQRGRDGQTPSFEETTVEPALDSAAGRMIIAFIFHLWETFLAFYRLIFPPEDHRIQILYPPKESLYDRLPPGLKTVISCRLSRMCKCYVGCLRRKSPYYFSVHVLCICDPSYNNCCTTNDGRPHTLLCIAWKAHATGVCRKLYNNLR
ncbi:ORF10 [Siadenovirus carbocapituli]|uniref:ORF10 n=1 Tax=Siadenovirus sp. TaxID=2671519 RepID=A0A9E7QWK6_9ADEN|nr:ORF10 [Siadenovirus sp.]